MKLFECQNCGLLVYFENVRCERCGAMLGFRPETAELTALTPVSEGVWRALDGSGEDKRLCANAEVAACNWLVPAASPETFCASCRKNRTIPDLSVAQNLVLWRRLELSKHRLVYSLLRLGLPLDAKTAEDECGIAFDFLADTDPANPVLTGHLNGLITINIAEADDAEREARRSALNEPYRTLLGHFRHEVGHYYWNLLVRDGGLTGPFRALFGDESADYGEALRVYYANGAPPDWQQRHVSAYASAHPWEDFAETWAHYLHIVDTLETANAFGMRVRPRLGGDDAMSVAVYFDPYADGPFERIIGAWLPLTYAVNSLNRSMGQPDLYPFVLEPAAIEKLGFIHRMVHGRKEHPAP